MSQPSARVLALVVVSALQSACVAGFGSGGPTPAEQDLRTLLREQAHSIDELRREQETLRAAFDEMRYLQGQATLRLRRGPIDPDTGEGLFAGGRRATPAVAIGGAVVPVLPIDDLEDDLARADLGLRLAPTPGTQPQTPAGVPLELPTVPAPLAGTVYEHGVRALVARDYDAAVQNFRDFLRENRASPYADDAQYWIAEAYFRKGQYHRAIIEFNQVAISYGSGDRAPAGLLRQAEVFRMVGDRVDARLSLQKVLSKYPNSAEAERARRLLSEIGG